MRTKTPEQHEAEYRWLKPEEVAERIGVDSADTVRLYIRKGLLEAIDVSRSNKPRYRISPKAVEAFNAEEAGAMTQPDAVSQGEMERDLATVRHLAGHPDPYMGSLARLVVSLDKRLTEVSGKLLVLTRMGESTNEDVGSLNNDAESFEQRIAYLESTLSAIQAGMDDAERTPEEWRATATNELLHHSGTPVGAGREDGQGEREKLADCLDGIRGFGQLFSSDHVILFRAAAALRASQEDGERVENTWWFQANREDVATIVGMLGRLTTRVAKLEATACVRCGHPQDWHRHDDTTEVDAFRCLGYDCDAPASGPKRRCDCPDYHPATESREAPAPSCDVVCQSCGARYCTKAHPYCPRCAASQSTPAQPDAPPDDAALGWIGCVCYELTEAGFPAGDRTVALASIRRLIAEHRPAPVESGDERKAGGGRALRALLQGELTRWMYSVSKIQSPVDVAKRADIIATTIEALQLARSPLPHENEPVAYISRDTLQRLKSGWSSGSQLYGRKEIAVPLEQVIPLFTASPSLPDQKARVGTPLEQALHFRENLAIGLEQAAVMIRTDGENFHQKARVGTLSWEEARELIEAAFARCYRAQHGGNFQEPWNGHGNEAKRLLSALGFTDRSEP